MIQNKVKQFHTPIIFIATKVLETIGFLMICLK